MATLDASPSLFAGQPWTIWEDQISIGGKNKLMKHPSTTPASFGLFQCKTECQSAFTFDLFFPNSSSTWPVSVRKSLIMSHCLFEGEDKDESKKPNCNNDTETMKLRKEGR